MAVLNVTPKKTLICSDIFVRRPDALLGVAGTDDGTRIVTHEVNCIRILRTNTRMLEREIVLEARKCRVSGYLLAAIVSDEPQINIYDIVNSNRPLIKLQCPQMVPR